MKHDSDQPASKVASKGKGGGEAPVFTVDTGSMFAENIERHFESLFEEYTTRPTTYLEIGVMEGKSAVLMLDNILTHPESRLRAVDPWDSMPKVEATARRNLEGYGVRVHVHKGTMRSALKEKAWREGEVDIAYHDGGKAAADVLEASVLIWPLLKDGGILIWDDYLWKAEECGNKTVSINPSVGIDAFLKCIDGRYSVLFSNWQLAVRKTLPENKGEADGISAARS